MEFLTALHDHIFLQHALIAGLLASVGCGIMGSYVVVKRITFLAGGIAHTVLAGMGIALFLGSSPIWGALITAIIAALLIGWIRLTSLQHEDTVIGAFWSVGMAIGVIFVSKTPGYNLDIMHYLFGNILMVGQENLLFMTILNLILVAIAFFFYRPLLAICFDEEFARTRGLPVTFFYLLLLCMVAISVVLLIQVVGLILVLALLTLPAAIAASYTRGLASMMLVAALIGMLTTSSGLVISYTADIPAGATIVLVAGVLYLLSLLIPKPAPRN